MGDYEKRIRSQLNERIENLKKLKPEYADSFEKAFKSALEEIDTYPYFKKITYLTDLNDSLDFSEGTEDRP